MPLVSSRLDSDFIREFANAVRNGLCKPQKELPSKYLYDEVGSALFDAITVLPEYGLTRADERLLHKYAVEIVQKLEGDISMVAELGSGSGRKTEPILSAIAARRPFVSYYAIDVSPSALDRCSRELGRLRRIRFHTVQQSYLQGLQHVRERRSLSERMLVLFLGSTIGNFNRSQASWFLTQLREILMPGDALLIGADLVKPEKLLLEAYDDSAGVTAAFNLNLLCRINRELDGNFEVRNFRHRAVWRPEERRIEMHLQALKRQIVAIRAAQCEISFREGETIHTESSHKFDAGELASMAAETGFLASGQWIDRKWPFAENLWIVQKS
jgi:dimethylhistidine N-methyltransferase